jgi:hypothetical protein
MHTEFWWRNLREGDHLEDPGVDGGIILKWIAKGHGLEFFGSAKGKVKGCSCESGNEPSDSIKCRKFHD